jgi:hypothetical protein
VVSAAELAPEAAQADIRASHVDPAARAARWFSQPLFDDVLADAAASAVTAGKKKRAAPVVHDSDDEEEEEEEAPAAPRARAGMTLSTLDFPGSMHASWRLAYVGVARGKSDDVWGDVA